MRQAKHLRTRRSTASSVLLLMLAQSGWAQDPELRNVTETQHALEADLAVRQRLHVTLHSRLRTQPSGMGLYQLRMGPVMDFSVRTNTSLLAGYYLSVQQQGERDVRGSHRYFGGLEQVLLERRAVVLEWRVLAERFVVKGADFGRLRNRIRVSGTGSAAPYVSTEWFHDRKGLRGVRYSGGLRWRYARRMEFDAGYFYEPRREALGPNRHMFLTGIRFRLDSGRRSHPDL